jgi:hypothetical protein
MSEELSTVKSALTEALGEICKEFSTVKPALTKEICINRGIRRNV